MWPLSDCLSPNCPPVGSIQSSTVSKVSGCIRHISDIVGAYQMLHLLLRWMGHHCHCISRFLGTGTLLESETLHILADCLDTRNRFVGNHFRDMVFRVVHINVWHPSSHSNVPLECKEQTFRGQNLHWLPGLHMDLPSGFLQSWHRKEVCNAPFAHIET